MNRTVLPPSGYGAVIKHFLFHPPSRSCPMKQVRENMQGVAKLCEQRLRSRPTPCRPLPKAHQRYCESLVFVQKTLFPLPSAVCLGLLIIQASPGEALRPRLVPAGWGALAGGLLARFGEKTAWDLVRQSPLPRAKRKRGAEEKEKRSN